LGCAVVGVFAEEFACWVVGEEESVAGLPVFFLLVMVGYLGSGAGDGFAIFFIFIPTFVFILFRFR
jgi:hypothetical protein